jgi:hypothetical protein
LVLLENNKYVESFCSHDGKRWFWQLTDKGYKVLNFSHQQIRQTGYKSEFKDHDFLVTLLHFSMWYTFSDEKSEFFTEQELRRIDVESYPNWVPHTIQHRSDGYFKIDLSLPNNKSLVAIEVELNLKSAQTYTDLGVFYSDILDISQVIWLVKTETDAKFIQRNLMKDSSTKAMEHSFYILDQWLQDHWLTKIMLGKDRNQTLLNSFYSSPIPTSSRGMEVDYFNFHKKLTNSINQKSTEKIISAHNKIIGY